MTGGAVAERVRALAWTGDRAGPGRVRIQLRQFRFGTLAIPFTPLWQCLSEETLKDVGPFYLVAMPGEVKYPTNPHWNGVTVVDTITHSNPPSWHWHCPVNHNHKTRQEDWPTAFSLSGHYVSPTSFVSLRTNICVHDKTIRGCRKCRCLLCKAHICIWIALLLFSYIS